MIILYALIFIISLLLYWIHQKRIDEDSKVGVPGPKGLPLLGCMFDIQPYVKAKNMFKMFHKYHNIYGETYQIRLGPSKMIVSINPKITEAIVNNPKFGKSTEYNLVKPWLGESMLLSNGEKWHKKRKLLTPAFHFQILERFIPIFEEQTGVFIKNIQNEITKGFDVFPMLHFLTLDIIAETSMGVQLNAQTNSQSAFIEANQTLTDIIDKRVYSGYLSIDFIFRLSKLYQVQVENSTFLNDYIDKVIIARQKKLLEENKNLKNNETDFDTKKRPALLDILLQAKLDGEPLSNEDIQSEVKTFMFAGHETTANSLCFVLYFIAKYPLVQEKLWNEIKSKNLNRNVISIRDLNSLSYMDNVIKETLRMCAPATMVLKQCKEDVRIEGVFIPANTTVATNIYSAHRSEKYFKDPEEFNPDRFDNEISTEDRNPYIFQPFSSGLRNCIGQRFAMLEMKTILVKLLSAFEMTLIDKDFEVDIIQSGTLKSKNGVQLRFKDRH